MTWAANTIAISRLFLSPSHEPEAETCDLSPSGTMLTARLRRTLPPSPHPSSSPICAVPHTPTFRYPYAIRAPTPTAAWRLFHSDTSLEVVYDKHTGVRLDPSTLGSTVRLEKWEDSKWLGLGSAANEDEIVLESLPYASSWISGRGGGVLPRS
jgi:hypothetical protein